MKGRIVVLLCGAYLMTADGGMRARGGQAESPRVQRLSLATTLRCRFPGFDQPLIFDSIDREAGRARFIGNRGATTVQVVPIVDGGLTLLEFPPIGYGNFTSVFVNETSKGEKVFPAVHSRHFAGLGGKDQVLPSQVIGTCEVVEPT